MPEAVVDEGGTVPYQETTGSFLFTSETTQAMIDSLREHSRELERMGKAEVDKLERWRNFCLRNRNYCVLYQIDF